MRGLALLFLVCFSLRTIAVVETFDFASEELRARYLRFASELRCPKCQNQNLADSNAPIAADLRHELYRLLKDGRSDAEIVEFMVSRYGEYVLYKPRLEPRTWLLWGTPALLLLAGLVVLWRMQVYRKSVRDLPAPLNEDELRRLRQLLDEQQSQ